MATLFLVFQIARKFFISQNYLKNILAPWRNTFWPSKGKSNAKGDQKDNVGYEIKRERMREKIIKIWCTTISYQGNSLSEWTRIFDCGRLEENLVLRVMEDWTWEGKAGIDRITKRGMGKEEGD